MEKNFDYLWSDNVKKMKKSIIRELLKLTQRPEIISFAGGLPDPKLFPYEDIKECMNSVLYKNGAMALQYGTTEGDMKLRNHLVKRYNELEGLNISADNILITTASQQGLDFCGRVFINPGDVVLCELPSYLGGLNAFTASGAELCGIEMDENGMCSDKLDESIYRLKKAGKVPKFIYVVPDFQNPAGVTMGEKRRMEILEIAYKYDLPIIEDSPYRDLRFDGESQPMFQKLDSKNMVITLGTFSKVLSPGFRLGWVLADPYWLDKFITVKQIADLCSASILQMTIAEYFDRNFYDKNLEIITRKYREKRDCMLNALEKYMPEGVSWIKPEGGLFLMVTLPMHIDSEKLFLKAVEKNVAFVIGHAFFCDDSGHNTMRLNFSFSTMEDNVEGIRRLSESIKEML
jgi:2-aminoadipate transaminase